MKLWVDTQTNLPVKLAMTGGQAGVSELTETYSEFTLDAKVDAKIFQLPK
jgi:outer membrane lipoprotein-sorting protein